MEANKASREEKKEFLKKDVMYLDVG